MNKATEKKLLTLVKESYAQIADDFNDSRKKQIWPELTKLAGAIDGSFRRQNVLDVGCGNGRLAALFQNQQIDYLGVDSCPELISLAKQNYGDRFALGDILTLSRLPSFNFDYVFCVAVLHHLPGRELRLEALKQLKSKIKPGGTIIITVWNLWQQKKYRRLILKYWLLKLLKKNQMDFGDIVFNWHNTQGQPTGRRYYHAFSRRQLAKLAQAADLTIEKLYQDNFNYYLILKKQTP